MKLWIDAFIAAYLCFAWFYDRPPPRTLVEDAVKNRLKRLLRFLTFEHNWQMFAQGTVTHTVMPLVVVVRSDGTTSTEEPPERFEFLRWKMLASSQLELVHVHLRYVLARLDAGAVEARFVIRTRELPPWPEGLLGRVDLGALGEAQDQILAVVRRSESAG
jgi:hypothetical protein